jgi:phage gp46-like protein
MDIRIDILDGLSAGMVMETTTGLWNNIYLSLAIRRGSWWFNPDFGSRLHLLHRAKNTARTEVLTREYCKEALQWLLDAGRASAVDISTEREMHRLKLLVEVTQADGSTVSFDWFVEVV